jgi:predicted GNAT family acetyltransferase
MSITLNEELNRFERAIGDDVAVLEFRRSDGVIDLMHTKVPRAHEGNGIGSSLVQHAVEYARAQNLRVVPSCPFVGAWLKRNPEYADVVRAR